MTHPLPPWMRASRITVGQPLEDDATAYRPLLGRWLLDLGLMLGWDRPRDAEKVPGIFSDPDFHR